MTRIRLVQERCKRCGKEVCAANRSILGLDTLKGDFGTVCQDCVTPEERETLSRQMGEQLAAACRPIIR